MRFPLGVKLHALTARCVLLRHRASSLDDLHQLPVSAMALLFKNLAFCHCHDVEFFYETSSPILSAQAHHTALCDRHIQQLLVHFRKILLLQAR